jgi:hypothetical protein
VRALKLAGLAILVQVVLAFAASSIAAADPLSPQSCMGQIVAATNHISGDGGASGNPQASAGPGFFLGPNTAGAIVDVRSQLCS